MEFDNDLPLADLAKCLADVVDCVDSSVAGHHHRVAILCQSLPPVEGLDDNAREQLVLAGALHDIGALSLSERLDSLEFDLDHSEHCLPGYLLLREFRPFTHIADIVRCHHVRFEDVEEHESLSGARVPFESQVLYFADRLAVLSGIFKNEPDANLAIRRVVEENSGTMFEPRVASAALSVPDTHDFWRYLTASPAELGEVHLESTTTLPWDCLEDFALTVARIIDFRCQFTASHSSGVATCAATLALLSGMSSADTRLMGIAGYLHDVGKLAIPKELIEKRSALTDEEMRVIRSHVAFSSAALWRLGSPPKVQLWVGRHHERPNGKGYPAGLTGEDLDLGCRILALADVFVALAEDRPYRSAMTQNETTEVLRAMAERGDLDADLVERLIEYYPVMNATRSSAQRLCRHDFNEFHRQLETWQG